MSRKQALLDKAAYWLKRSQNETGVRKKQSMANHYSYKSRANKLAANIDKQTKNKHQANQVANPYTRLFYNECPFEPSSVVIRLNDASRGDIAIVNGVKNYYVFVELKAKKSIWLPIIHEAKLADAIKAMSAYLISNCEIGFYEEE